MPDAISLYPQNNGIPSLRISTAAGCNHRCLFCQVDGDFASDYGQLSRDNLAIYFSTIDRCFQLGVRHFSLTGGEPLLHPYITFNVASHIRELIGTLPDNERAAGYLRLNTNGVFVSKYAETIAERFDLTKISLHTLRKDRYQHITGSLNVKRDFESIFDGIRALGRLHAKMRVHMVVGRFNVDEVPKVLSFCESSPGIIELKLFDVSEYSELWRGHEAGAEFWRKNYVDLAEIEDSISRSATLLGVAYSVGGYGNPMPVYQTALGLRIRIRRTNGGAFYGGACRGCHAYIFCGDGHCNLTIGPNRILKVCRPKEGRVFQLGEEANALVYFKTTMFRVNEHLDRALC